MIEDKELPEICKTTRTLHAGMVAEEEYVRVRGKSLKECEDTLQRLWKK